MTSMHEILVDVMSESAMTTFAIPCRLVPNAFAIGAFEVHPKPEMRSAFSLRPNGLNVRWRCWSFTVDIVFCRLSRVFG